MQCAVLWSLSPVRIQVRASLRTRALDVGLPEPGALTLTNHGPLFPLQIDARQAGVVSVLVTFMSQVSVPGICHSTEYPTPSP